MDGVERGSKWKILKERLGFKGIGCCGGATWGIRASSNMMVREEEEDERETTYVGQISAENGIDQVCLGQITAVPASPGMNLATALAAERHLRAVQDWEGDSVGPTGSNRSTSAPGTPLRMSLMRLLEETDGCDGENEKEKEKEREGCVGNDAVCCVCMGRRKGAAFIPCGHTFCRVCSRELWLNRGSCPLCNRSVLEILDIF